MSSPLLDKARQLFPPELDAFVRGGGKVVGYACVATPRELFDALGLLPYRLRALGSHRRDRADSVLSRFNCSFCRSCLQLALEGEFDVFDGLVASNGCDHLRGMFEGWQAQRPTAFYHYLKVPHLTHDDALAVYVEQLQALWQALSDHFGGPKDDQALARAVERQRRIRRLLRRARALRQRAEPLISGSESLALMLLESTLPVDDFERLLEQLVRQREADATPLPHRARLLLAGGATDELHLIEAIEQLGGLVLADGLCHGSRAFFRAAEGHEPQQATIASLARSTLDAILCPRMFEQYPDRLAYLLDQCRRAQVHGAVLVHNKFCDLHGVDNLMLAGDLRQRGVPTLVLEKEYGATADIGRYLTRVQAFIEQIGR